MVRNTAKADTKAIRVFIKNQLESKHPDFSSLKRKQKQKVVEQVSLSVMASQKTGELVMPMLSAEERVGLGQLPEGIMSLEAMARFIDDQHRMIFPLPNPSRDKYIRLPLLQAMDAFLDDSVIDSLLAPPGMTPGKRKWMPSRLLRIELLRTALFPELSVRKFCSVMQSLERKQERAFCHLSLVRLEMCSHTVLSAFRLGLTFEQRVNLMVYMAHHFFASGRLGESVMHMIDSTDLATPISPRPLHKIELPDGDSIRFYTDLGCDCGSRRNKRDKSKMLVGYRVHTLCVTDMETRIAFPLFSVAAAANHHDSQLLEPLLAIARAAGIEMKLLSADEAYADATKQSTLLEEHDLRVVTPPKAKAAVPKDVDAETSAVYGNGACEIPMKWSGYDPDDAAHVFACNDDAKACLFKAGCLQERLIPIDTGLFGPLPSCIEETQQAIDARKVTERPFNLLKHMDGLEPCRMKNLATVSAQVVFSQMVGILKVMAGLRSVPKIDDRPRQEVMPLAVNG